jgi:beta-glucosidase-like glycosyl hydrolase
MKKRILVAACLLFSVSLWAQQYPYQNPKLSSEERAKDLISRLTLEEKAILMCDISDAIPRFGIKKFNWWSEALHGLANNGNVTVFPEPVGMAASFDDALLYRIFDAVSDETRAKYNEACQKGLGQGTGNLRRRSVPDFAHGCAGRERFARSGRCQIPETTGLCQTLRGAFRTGMEPPPAQPE